MKDMAMGSFSSIVGDGRPFLGEVGSPETEPDIADRLGEGASSSTMCPCIRRPVITSLALSSVYSSASSSSSGLIVAEGVLTAWSLGKGVRVVGGDAESSLVDW